MESLLLQIGTGVINAVNSKLERMIELAPFVLGAMAVFLFGWILAEIISRTIINLGHKIHLEAIGEKIGLKHFLEGRKSKKKPTEVIAKGVKGYLIFVFFMEATKIAQLTQIAEFSARVLSYIPQVIVALFIMLVGIRIGNTMQGLISTSLSFAKANTAAVLGHAAKATIVTFAILAALTQLEIAEILIQILFVGFVAMLTMAGGLSFGLGGQQMVGELLEDIKKVEMKEIRKEIKEELKDKAKSKKKK